MLPAGKETSPGVGKDSGGSFSGVLLVAAVWPEAHLKTSKTTTTMSGRQTLSRGDEPTAVFMDSQTPPDAGTFQPSRAGNEAFLSIARFMLSHDLIFRQTQQAA